jgi:hypothetical protein
MGWLSTFLFVERRVLKGESPLLERGARLAG